jgi:hypothetical protein
VIVVFVSFNFSSASHAAADGVADCAPSTAAPAQMMSPESAALRMAVLYA